MAADLIGLCLGQAEIIEKQAATIRRLLEEVALHRALTEEERRELREEG